MSDAFLIEDPVLFFSRGVWVILDRELARVFGVTVSQLNQAVRRHPERFTEDYGFRLSPEETTDLRSQFVTSNPDLVARLRTPMVFTEERVIMAATVLTSPAAIAATKQVVRTFVDVQRQRRDGQNTLPVPETGAEVIPSALRQRLDGAIEKLADLALTRAEQKAAMTEAKKFKEEGLNALHSWLERQNLKNAEAVARIERDLAQAEKLRAEAAHMRTETQDKERLALIRELLFVSELERATRSGDLATFSAMLKGLDR